MIEPLRKLADRVRARLNPEMKRLGDWAGGPPPVRFPWEPKARELWWNVFERQFPRTHDEAHAYSVLVYAPNDAPDAFEANCKQWINGSTKGAWCMFRGFGNGVHLGGDYQGHRPRTYSFEREEDAALFKLFFMDPNVG